MEITFDNFKHLDINKKADLVFNQGVFIAAREYYNQRLVLYSIGNFFAEVYYDPKENTIHKIEGIKEDDKRIDRYIDQNK